LSFEIVGCIFDVHHAVGSGLREECCQKALEQRLYEKGLSFIAKPAPRRDLIHRGEVAGPGYTRRPTAGSRWLNSGHASSRHSTT
jgi:hypothetical protein